MSGTVAGSRYNAHRLREVQKDPRNPLLCMYSGTLRLGTWWSTEEWKKFDDGCARGSGTIWITVQKFACQFELAQGSFCVEWVSLEWHYACLRGVEVLATVSDRVVMMVVSVVANRAQSRLYRSIYISFVALVYVVLAVMSALFWWVRYPARLGFDVSHSRVFALSHPGAYKEDEYENMSRAMRPLTRRLVSFTPAWRCNCNLRRCLNGRVIDLDSIGCARGNGEWGGNGRDRKGSEGAESY